MESPLRYDASDDLRSPWLRYHLGHQKQPPQRTKYLSLHPQQQRRQQPPHLNTLGLRLNAAGNIKPSVIQMPSLEHHWKIHYSYKTSKVISRSVNDDAILRVDSPVVPQRNTRPRLDSGKRSPSLGGGTERPRVRSAASGAHGRGGERLRSPRIRAGTPELVTTTPIRLLGVLRSPEHAPLNWRANDGRPLPPRYFTFPPVTTVSRRTDAATSLLGQRERKGKVSTAQVESRLDGEAVSADLLTLSRSSSSESMPSAWKYAEGSQTNTKGTHSNGVTDDPTAEDPSALPTISEEQATTTTSEMNHSISVRISRNSSIDNRYNSDYNNDCNNNSIDNRYNKSSDNDNDEGLGASDEQLRRSNDDVDGDSDSLSVYDDDGEDADDEEWTREERSSEVLAIIPQSQLVRNESTNEDRNKDHNGDQPEDQNKDQLEDQPKDQNKDQLEDHSGLQTEDYSGNQHEENNRQQHGIQNRDHHEDPSEGQIEDHKNGDQTGDHSGHQDPEQNRDVAEDSKLDQNDNIIRTEKTDPREHIADDDSQKTENWTKEVNDFSPTQRSVYPPLTSRDRGSDSPPVPQDIPNADQSQMTTESKHDVTDDQQSSTIAPRQMQEADEVESSKEIVVATDDVGYAEEFYEEIGKDFVRGEQDVKGQKLRGQDVKGQEARGQEVRSEDVRGQNVSSTIDNLSKDAQHTDADENNNVLGTENGSEAKKADEEIGETSSNTEPDTETDLTKSVERDSQEEATIPRSLEETVDMEEAIESTTETVGPPMAVVSTELIHAGTDSQGDDFNDHGHQQNDASTDDRLDSLSEETVSLESTVVSQEERRSPMRAKAARKRSVRFSLDVATVYLFRATTPAEDSETSDSGFLSP